MVIVTGRHLDFLSRVAAALGERGHEARAVVCEGADDSDALFDAVLEARPSHLAVVEPLPRVVGAAPAPDDALLDAALRATRCAAHPTLLWVTGLRADGDPGLTRIRRSGALYDLLITGELVEATDPSPPLQAGGEVIVPVDLAVPARGLCTVGSIAEGLATAIADDESVGRTLEIGWSGQDAWDLAVQSLGARPRRGQGLGARLAGWTGTPVLSLPGAAARPG